MSRSGYTNDHDHDWQLIMWRGAVKSAIQGRRGQAFLREMMSALDALPTKRLISDELEAGGEVCALGAIGRQRGVDMSNVDPYDRETVATTFGVAPALAAELMDVNDQDIYWQNETPEARWQRVRDWISRKIVETT